MATARRSEALSPADAAALFRSPASSNRSVALASKVCTSGEGEKQLAAGHMEGCAGCGIEPEKLS